MCGSFGITWSTTIHLPQRFGFDERDTFAKFDDVRYLVHRNIPTVSRNSPNKLIFRHWSFSIPGTDKQYSLFNAKSETVRELRTYKPSWDNAQRCLIPCTFFNETNRETKQRYRITLKSGKPFALAGLYQIIDGQENVTMLTTEPNHDMKHAHHRMPAIIFREDESKWLDRSTDLEEAYKLLVPYPDGELIVAETKTF